MNLPGADNLTVVILTYNEENNLKRVLDKLAWLHRVVVLDSYSNDSTATICSQYNNTEIFYRKFDTHATQWNHALSLAKSEWVLTLDADYVLTQDFIDETTEFINKDDKVAYYAAFKFLVFGKQLFGDNTKPRPVLFKKNKCSYFDDGHTQRLKINGESGFFSSFILHDDRKPLSRWLKNQDDYSVKECNKLTAVSKPAGFSFIDKIRKTKIFAPLFIFFYCLIFKRLIFNGWAGWYYTLQRTMVEMLFALRLIENEKFKK